mmetsp:Transcript_28090/g.52686  ORF Transcript_28090/g.52686 Transcript_28090/m.52686 type:complete len:97 (+) Transcript_28090:613-903(+)
MVVQATAVKTQLPELRDAPQMALVWAVGWEPKVVEATATLARLMGALAAVDLPGLLTVAATRVALPAQLAATPVARFLRTSPAGSTAAWPGPVAPG